MTNPLSKQLAVIENTDLLLALLQCPANRMLKVLKKNPFGKLFAKPPLIVQGSYGFWQGQAPYLLVAHIDTVNAPSIIVEPELTKNGATIRSRGQKTPLGADDRAGVFAIMEICRNLQKAGLALPSVLLTDGEEVGGRGARAFAAFCRKSKAYQKLFEGFNLVIELDRRGLNDWISYAWDSQANAELVDFLEAYGYQEATGSYSDIAEFETLAADVPMINLSAGYFNEHTNREYLNLYALDFTIKAVIGMLSEAPPLWPNVPASRRTAFRYHGFAGYYDAIDDDDDDGDGYDNFYDYRASEDPCASCDWQDTNLCESCVDSDFYENANGNLV